MKITKRQLRRIIKEEKQRMLKEQWGDKEAANPLIAFGVAWSSLGGAVQEQILDLTNAYVGGSSGFQDAVGQINPNALDLAFNRLQRPLSSLASGGSEDAHDILSAISEAEEMYNS